MSNIINVPGDQPTIQQGIDAAVDGDTVLVQPGNYVENINYYGKNITVGSLFLITQDTTYISQTIIDGNQNGSVVTFENMENATALLSGFRMINGTGSYVDLLGNGGYYNIGGGICCIWNSNPSIDNIMISENYAEHGGGGIFCFESNPSIKNVKIYNNSTGSIGSGGGICCITNSDPTIENVLILFNSAYVSGGICCDESSPSLKNVKIIDNSGGNNGGGI
ncbi:MAG: hypothetical protein KAW87_03705, partial [Candidatus Cloacimonetes bacterium]|nr:hypothetical protein [Candidatus Cloacimonadota bacterium]